LWESLRYLDGGLTVAERDAFEARLEHDLAAGESLAQAVLLTEALALAPNGASVAAVDRQDNVARPRRRRNRWAARVGAAAVAGLLLTIGWYAGGLAERGSGPVSPGSIDLAVRPAAGGIPDGAMLDVWVSLNADREATADEAAVEPAADAVGETDVPDWMFAALLAVGDREVLPSGMGGLMEGAL
jgi:hypothetical protein